MKNSTSVSLVNIASKIEIQNCVQQNHNSNKLQFICTENKCAGYLNLFCKNCVEEHYKVVYHSRSNMQDLKKVMLDIAINFQKRDQDKSAVEAKKQEIIDTATDFKRLSDFCEKIYKHMIENLNDVFLTTDKVKSSFFDFIKHLDNIPDGYSLQKQLLDFKQNIKINPLIYELDLDFQEDQAISDIQDYHNKMIKNLKSCQENLYYSLQHSKVINLSDILVELKEKQKIEKLEKLKQNMENSSLEENGTVTVLTNEQKAEKLKIYFEQKKNEQDTIRIYKNAVQFLFDTANHKQINSENFGINDQVIFKLKIEGNLEQPSFGIGLCAYCYKDKSFNQKGTGVQLWSDGQYLRNPFNVIGKTLEQFIAKKNEIIIEIIINISKNKFLILDEKHEELCYELQGELEHQFQDWCFCFISLWNKKQLITILQNDVIKNAHLIPKQEEE